MKDESTTRQQSNDSQGRSGSNSPAGAQRPLRGGNGGTSPTGSQPYHLSQCLRPSSLLFQPQQYQHAMVRYITICRERDEGRQQSPAEEEIEKEWRATRQQAPQACSTINFIGFPRPCCHSAVEGEEVLTALCGRASRQLSETEGPGVIAQQHTEIAALETKLQPLAMLFTQLQYERHLFLKQCRAVGGCYGATVDMAVQTQPVPTELYGRAKYSNAPCACEACSSGVTQPIRVRDFLMQYHQMFSHQLPPIQAVPQLPHQDPGCVSTISAYLCQTHELICKQDAAVRAQYDSWRDSLISLRYPWVRQEIQKTVCAVLPEPVAQLIAEFACPEVEPGTMFDVEDLRGRNIWYKMVVLRVVAADQPDIRHIDHLRHKEEEIQQQSARKRVRKDLGDESFDQYDEEHQQYMAEQNKKLHSEFRQPDLTDAQQGLEDFLTRTYGPHAVEEPQKRHRYAAEGPQPGSSTPQLLVHYVGWQTRWDEYISASSLRIAPRGTRVGMDASTGPDYSSSRTRPPPPPPTPTLRQPDHVDFGIATHFMH